MIILEITMPYGKVVKIKYEDTTVAEVQESLEKLYEYQDRLYYLSFPETVEGKSIMVSPDIFKQCILEFYNE
jgi:hypothetical protein